MLIVWMELQSNPIPTHLTTIKNRWCKNRYIQLTQNLIRQNLMRNLSSVNNQVPSS